MQQGIPSQGTPYVPTDGKDVCTSKLNFTENLILCPC